MTPTDLKYVGISSLQLDHYTIKKQYPFKSTFRCPMCGDSKKSKSKTRAWFIEYKDLILFNCFNCGAKMSLMKFLGEVNPALRDEYIVDRRLDRYSQVVRMVEPKQPQPEQPVVESPLLKLKRISELPIGHPALVYVQGRRIPVDKQKLLYFAPQFAAWVNSIMPNKLDATKDEPRLILPMLDWKGTLMGFQGRSFKKSGLRYITIMLGDYPKVFGLDRVNFGMDYCIVEGGLDSLFLTNSLAMSGADMPLTALRSKQNAVFVFDREPRNAEIVKRMEKCIASGFKLCIWPDGLQGKDINDFVMGGITPKQIQDIIYASTYSGMNAKLELSSWKKV